METPYPSQLTLASSSDASNRGSGAPNSTSSCLSTGASSTTIIDEPRQQQKRDTDQEEEDELRQTRASQRDMQFDGTTEEGSSARPRTILRRSRTTAQVDRARNASTRARRAASISLSQDGQQQWPTTLEQTRSGDRAFNVDGDLAVAQWPTTEEGQGVDVALPEKTRKNSASFARVDSTFASAITQPSLPAASTPTRPSIPGSEPLNRSASLPSCSFAMPSPHPTSLSPETFPPSQSIASSRPEPYFSVSPPLYASTSSRPVARHRRSASLPISWPSPVRVSRAALCAGTSTPHAQSDCRNGTTPLSNPELKSQTAATRRDSFAKAEARPTTDRVFSHTEIGRIHAARLSRRGKEPSAPVVPASVTPPISRSTLRELDLQEVLRNAQLRHDVVFDPNLMFRPNFDGERGERKRVVAEQYWTAIASEISTGCRCSSFVDSELLPCICAGHSSSTSTANASRFPTRITPLVAELRGILLSLLPATVPNSPTPPSTAVFETQPSLAAKLPVYGPREQLIDALDPILITRQLVQGVLDVAGLARFLGATLKTHCAPMRDELVDEMVSTAEGPDGAVAGLRMCFEILELMKLDIANHQLRSLRPYLLQTSVEFERRFFDSFNSRINGAPLVPRSRAWINKAVDSLPALSETLSLPRQLGPSVDRALTRGILDVIFSPPPSPSTVMAPSSRRGSLSDLPETLQLDSYRLAHFHCDATDLTVVYMLTLLYQQISYPARPSPADVDLVRNELWCIMSSNMNSLPSLVDSPATVVGIPSGPAGHGATKLEDESWRAAMQDVIFQVAARAQQAKLAHASSTLPPVTLPTPDQHLVSLVQGYFDANARVDSKVFSLLSNRLSETLEMYVVEELEKEKRRGDHEFVNWWSTNPGQVTMRTGHRRAPAPSVESSKGSEANAFTPSSNMMASPAPVTHCRGTKRSHSEDADDSEPVTTLDEVEKRQRIGLSTSLPVRHASTSRFDAALSRNGLSSLSHEIKVLGDRIAKVASFNLSVFRPLYESLLSERLQ
ncbi:hypothetical protein JCM3766R1_000371 [Sporobolomyces carnicolor]